MNERDEKQLDLYLDGLIDEAERRRFELRIEADAELRAAVEAQARIDASIRRLFAPPACQPHIPRSAGTSRSRLLRGAWVAAAALLIGCGILLGLLSRTRHPEMVYAPEIQRSTFQAIHERLVDRGYTPEWVCPPGPKFAMCVYWRLGQTLLVSHTPPGVELLGWTYAPSLSPETMVLLTRVDDRPVTVFVDRLEVDTSQQLTDSQGLRLFRRQVHDLVAYELSEGPQPVILPLLFEPPIEPGWKDIPLYEETSPP